MGFHSPLIRPAISWGGGIGGGTLGSHDIYTPENSHAIMEPPKNDLNKCRFGIWKMISLFKQAIFRFQVSFSREKNYSMKSSEEKFNILPLRIYLAPNSKRKGSAFCRRAFETLEL